MKCEMSDAKRKESQYETALAVIFLPKCCCMSETTSLTCALDGNEASVRQMSSCLSASWSQVMRSAAGLPTTILLVVGLNVCNVC